MTAALELRGVGISRGGRRLFSELSLTLAQGEACAVTGANGAGKTSLLRAVAGLLSIDEGEIAFGGLEPAAARAQGIHYLGHHDGLKPARTALEEFSFWTRWDDASAAMIALAMASLELEPLFPLEVRRLSAGQRRRLALGRLVAASRPLWLLDEPTGPLDAEWRVRFANLMAMHLETGGTVLAAVHDPLPGATRSLEIAP